MRKMNMLLILVLFLAGCGQGNSAENPATPTNPTNGAGQEEEQSALLLERADIVRKDGNRWLVTALGKNSDGDPFIDAYTITVNDKTILENESGEAAAAEDFNVGSRVEVWHTGAIAESYPAQTTAGKLILAEDENGRSAAVQAALLEWTEPSMAWAVKDAEFDADAGVWTVEMVTYESIHEPTVVKVDAATGEIVPEIVAENDAFRVFAPKPESEAGQTFTVSGEARVFEAAFSWILEDGHVILAEGHEMTDAGAPEWGSFEFEVNYDKATQENMMLILYVSSAKDGSMQNELVIPLKAPKEHVERIQ